jgi:hypothetical protein
MNSLEFIEFAQEVRIKVIRSDGWSAVEKLPESADVIAIDCRDLLLYRICVHFLHFPWTRKPLVAVDLVLRRPVRLGQRNGALIMRFLPLRLDDSIHYFRDISGYTRHFGISPACSSYVVSRCGSHAPQ